jgi:hypothetical protein
MVFATQNCESQQRTFFHLVYNISVAIIIIFIMPLVKVDKIQLEQLQRSLKSRQTMYVAEAKARMAYQNALAEILQEVSNRSKDKKLVDEIVAVALGYERQAQMELATIKK